ncbi:hypothetical protein TNCV_3562491 [Trichonephila clavipes]|nr:hypothetical protein TNCV_3562491 [Trichonephila clavipes]
MIVCPRGRCGRGYFVVKGRTRCRSVMRSSLVPLKTRRVGARCPLNLSRTQTSYCLYDVLVRRHLMCQIRCRPLHLTMVQNSVVRRQKPSSS